MALIPCRECGKNVSSAAETCPHCGIKSPAAAPAKRLRYVLLGLVGLAVVGALMNKSDRANQPERSARATATLEQAARGTAALKRAVRNPDSFKLISVKMVESEGASCITYSAQNGFGGVSVEQAISTGGGVVTASGVAYKELFDRVCLSPDGTDETGYVKVATW